MRGRKMSITTNITASTRRVDRRWWALVLLAIADFVVVLDASIVNIALPSIGRGLHISLASLSWVVNAYVLTFGGFLLLGGRIADLLGRRLIFMVGLGVLSAASLLGGLAQSELWLFGARAIQASGRHCSRRLRCHWSPRSSRRAPSATGRCRCGARSPDRAPPPGCCWAACSPAHSGGVRFCSSTCRSGSSRSC